MRTQPETAADAARSCSVAQYLLFRWIGIFFLVMFGCFGLGIFVCVFGFQKWDSAGCLQLSENWPGLRKSLEFRQGSQHVKKPPIPQLARLGSCCSPPTAHRAGGLETRSCSRENQPRFNNVAARKSPKSWLVPKGEFPLETAALCSCSSEQSRWDRGLPSSLLGGEPRVFPAGRATNLEEFIETNTSFCNLFWSRELSVVSLKNCQKAVIILTLDLHNTLHISEETSSPAVSTTHGGVSGCANKRRQKMCCLSIALAKMHLFLPLLSLSPLVLLHLCHPGVRTCSFLTAACSCGFSWGDEGSCLSWQWLVLSAGRSFWYLAAQ